MKPSNNYESRIEKKTLNAWIGHYCSRIGRHQIPIIVPYIVRSLQPMTGIPKKKGCHVGNTSFNWWLCYIMFFENEGDFACDVVNMKWKFNCCDLYCCEYVCLCLCLCNCDCCGGGAAVWLFNWCTFRSQSFIFYKRLVIFQFFQHDVCVCTKSLFNMKKIYSKNTNGIETCLICSVSNNQVDLITFLSFYYPFTAIFVTILV